MQRTVPQPPSVPPAAPRHPLLGRALEWLFPNRCGQCESALHRAPNPWFCAACWAQVDVAYGAGSRLCDCCGVVAGSGAVMPDRWRCGECLKTPPAFQMARVMGSYDGVLGAALKQLKYRGRTGVASALVARLDAHRFTDALWQHALVIPVPLHARHLRRRGFNQAGRLAQALAKHWGLAVAHDLLLRHGASVSQVGLTRVQRRNNVRGAFRVADPARLAGRSVLLVDDVITTGATVGACANTLMQAGAESVRVWAVARQGLD